MTVEQQTNAFQKDLEALIDRFREEFDLPYFAVVGVLTMAAISMANEADDVNDDED